MRLFSKVTAKVLFTIQFIAVSTSYAQDPNGIRSDAASIIHNLEALHNFESVMYVAAHPDDENTRLLTWFSQERKARTAYFSFTRGDGGQNLIGTEQSEMLGVIRTQELLAARRIDGAKQFFSRAVDFGYSKNPEETMAVWNHDSVLYDLVWAIREFKPDVIICRFPNNGDGGHGHHTASALLAEEAFKIAADPKIFPDQLTVISVWQPKRIFWNAWRLKEEDVAGEKNMARIRIGDFNPVLGKSYTEIAAQSRSQHRSQGFGSTGSRGEQTDFLRLVMGDDFKEDIFEGVATNWQRSKASPEIITLATQIRSTFDAKHPEKSIESLLKLKNLMTSGKMDPFWKAEKLRIVDDLILSCAGIFVQANTKAANVVPGDSLKISVSVISRNGTTPSLLNYGFSIGSLPQMNEEALKNNVEWNKELSIAVPDNQPYSNPVWLQQEAGKGIYRTPGPYWNIRPVGEPDLEFFCTLKFGNTNVSVRRPVLCYWNDPVTGENYKPFEILPACSIEPVDAVVVFPDANEKKVLVNVQAWKDKISGTLKPVLPKGWVCTPSQYDFNFDKAGEKKEFSFLVKPLNGVSSATMTFSVTADNKNYSQQVIHVKYDHIPQQVWIHAAEIDLVRADIKRFKKRIAYIEGAGDEVPKALRQLGYEVTFLTDDSLASANLSRYETIVTGIRAYNTRDALAIWQKRLMEYVENGGTLLMQYNTAHALVTKDLGPYPMKLGRERVTVEESPVAPLEPISNLLIYPNLLNRHDYEDWNQERGLYFAAEWDEKYNAVFAMNDPDEKESRGSLIECKYGKGRFIYSGISFFRHLPNGIPGSYRLFVNLIEAK